MRRPRAKRRLRWMTRGGLIRLCILFGVVAEHAGVPATLAAGGAIVVLAVMVTGGTVPELRSA